ARVAVDEADELGLGVHLEQVPVDHAHAARADDRGAERRPGAHATASNVRRRPSPSGVRRGPKSRWIARRSHGASRVAPCTLSTVSGGFARTRSSTLASTKLTPIGRRTRRHRRPSAAQMAARNSLYVTRSGPPTSYVRPATSRRASVATTTSIRSSRKRGRRCHVPGPITGITGRRRTRPASFTKTPRAPGPYTRLGRRMVTSSPEARKSRSATRFVTP